MEVTKTEAARGYIIIDADKCKACGLCVHFCPKKNLGFSETANRRGFHPVRMEDDQACTGCGECAVMCPEICIQVFRRR
jgi:2-oxoglutarate ferredoxin oxidoreductase subunit delta